MVTYLESGNLAVFNGHSFRRDRKTGYFLCSVSVNGKRERLHRAVWRHCNGDIPEGLHVHHKDGDKSNNDISNLELKTAIEHIKWHGKHITEEHKRKLAHSLALKARPKAAEWHRSKAGKEWHSQMSARMWERRETREYFCSHCGRAFESLNYYSENENRFCCNNCKSAYRRRAGVDDEVRECKCCGDKYITNKYSARSFCTPKCRGAVRAGKGRQKVG